MIIKKVGVIGSGLMGAGIAQVAAASGYDVIVVDVAQKQLDQAIAGIGVRLEKQVAEQKISSTEKTAILKRLKTTTRFEDLSSVDFGVDFVIEAVSENEVIKKQVFQKLDEICPAHAILVSNTSSIPITRLASFVRRPGQVAGMHFMNPVPKMVLVEGIRGLLTSDETFSTVKQVSEKMGKRLIEAKDSPAFVVNRILVPMLNEAVFALQEGLATREDIDAAMKLGCNFPMGPFELLDFVGLDTALALMEVLYRETGDTKYRPCPLLRTYVDAGFYGRKSGRGFYTYDKA